MTPLTPAESWRLSHRDRPGAMPSREALTRLRPATIVGVRADVLLALVAECAAHDADSRPPEGSPGDEPRYSCRRTRADREIADARSLSVGLGS